MSQREKRALWVSVCVCVYVSACVCFGSSRVNNDLRGVGFAKNKTKQQVKISKPPFDCHCSKAIVHHFLTCALCNFIA